MTEDLDRGAVTDWVIEHVESVSPPLRFSLIAGGRSNLTYRVEDTGGRVLVLRRPPRGGVLATAHDMSREWRAVSALGPTPVPVPPALAFCRDEAVDGAQFYLMEFVAGTVVADARDAQALSASARGVAGRDLMSVMAAVHTVDPDEVGLGDLGRRDGYVERQLRRWKHQWDRSKTRELPAVEEGFQRLADRIPPQDSTAIVHGDFRLGNMILRPDGRVNAVLDWELCTLGDPLADLGWLLSDWSGADRGGTPGHTPPSTLDGFPSRDQMLHRYATATSRDVSRIDYYVAFARWRLACIGEGVYARYRSGVMGDVDVDLGLLRAQVEQRANAALDALDDLDRARR
jgi:aminoglycoside phosphotransferase (APT) family kinase protein